MLAELFPTKQLKSQNDARVPEVRVLGMRQVQSRDLQKTSGKFLCYSEELSNRNWTSRAFDQWKE